MTAVLKLLSTLAFLTTVGAPQALSPGSLVQITPIRYAGGNWNPRPQAARVLSLEVARRTSVETDLGPQPIDLADPKLFEHPILLLAGDRAFPPLPEPDVERLRHHIEAGGFLLIDNAGEGEVGTKAFDASVRRLVRRLFPSTPLKAIPSEHVIYRSFFRLDYPSGRDLRKGYMEGITLGRRVALVYSENDLTGALDRDAFGAWRHDLVPNTPGQREGAVRLGVNLVMYALCLHYKDDQVHIRFLLKKRNWRIKPPSTP